MKSDPNNRGATCQLKPFRFNLIIYVSLEFVPEGCYTPPERGFYPMKKIAILAVFALSAMGAEWTGAISESGCGAKHADGNVGCVTKCVKGGAAPVLVTGADHKVLKIANGDKVMDFLGKKVKVTGTLEGESVTIDTIEDAH